MKSPSELYGAPIGLVRGQENFTGLVDLIIAWRHGLHDGFNLRGVDAPHSGETHGLVGQLRTVFDGL